MGGIVKNTSDYRGISISRFCKNASISNNSILLDRYLPLNEDYHIWEQKTLGLSC